MKSPILYAALAIATGANAQVSLPPAPAGVTTFTRDGIEFSVIGAAGNRHANAQEIPEYHPPHSIPGLQVGGVEAEFAIGRTEMTAGQWIEFVQAYAPTFHRRFGNIYDDVFSGGPIETTLGQNGQSNTYAVPPGNERYPVNVSWEFAAIYCNWMTNGKQVTDAAFMSGAYDLGKVVRNQNGVWLTLPTRQDSATYWIPSLSEWTKAAFFDPNKNGVGQEGYWRYPNASDTPLIGGWPEDGGQTDFSIPRPTNPDDYRVNFVAAYAGVQEPWGLFDVSGGVNEWIDTPAGWIGGYAVRGSMRFDLTDPFLFYDTNYPIFSGSAHRGLHGLRLATVVPSPGTLLWIVVLTHTLRRSRESPDSIDDPYDSHPKSLGSHANPLRY